MARSQDLSTQQAKLLGRFAFTNGLFELQTTQSGKKQWNLTVLFPKSLDISALHSLALEAAKEEWGDKAVGMIQSGIIKSPFLDGDGPQGKNKKNGEPHKGFPGHTFIRMASGEDYRPKLLNAYTWETKEQGKGISFGFSYVMKAKDGESLGGGGAGSPEQFFEKIEDEGEAPAETKGAGAGGLFG